jgi:hypothetical protein
LNQRHRDLFADRFFAGADQADVAGRDIQKSFDPVDPLKRQIFGV